MCFEVKCADVAPFAGRCITGPNQVSVIVQITDACPECESNQMDIQVRAPATPSQRAGGIGRAARAPERAVAGSACMPQQCTLEAPSLFDRRSSAPSMRRYP